LPEASTFWRYTMSFLEAQETILNKTSPKNNLQ